MTLNANWESREGASAAQAEKRRRYQWREQRRWNLLATRHKLPARGWEAAREYVLWLDDEWTEVIVDREERGTDQLEPMRDRHFVAFAIGGAAAFLRGYDLPPKQIAEFMAGSLYVVNLKLSPHEIRRARYEAQELYDHLGGYLAAIYRTGMERGEWRLECRREREGCEAPPLVETTGDELEPPGLIDLIDPDLTLGLRAIH